MGDRRHRCFGWLTLRFVIAIHPASLTGLTGLTVARENPKVEVAADQRKRKLQSLGLRGEIRPFIQFIPVRLCENMAGPLQ